MTAYRAWTSLVGVLCLTGTAMGQSSYLGASDPYGVRMTRMEDSTSVRSPMLHSATPAIGDRSTASGNSNPETVATPQPAQGNVYQNALNTSGWGGEGCGCESCVPGCRCAQNNWYAYVGGLVMGRDMPNRFWTTFDQNNPANQLRYFPGSDWGGGIDTRIGYWFGCGCNSGSCDPCNQCCGCGGRFGIEAVYWGAWGLDGHTSINDPTNQLGTVQDDGLVSFGAAPASDFFDNARAVQLSRNDEFHNVEINFMYLPVYTGSRLQITGLMGVRFFRFSEGLDWGQLAGTAPAGARFGDNPADEAFVNVDVQNNLVGFQLGAYMNWQVCCNVSIFAVPKMGIFGNHINAHNSMVTGDGIVATFDNPPGSGNALNFHTSTDVFSVLGSIDVGVNWAISPNWSVVGGYRVVAVSGIALGDNQIPQFFADEAGWKEIKTNGNLILHGAFAGIEARF